MKNAFISDFLNPLFQNKKLVLNKTQLFGLFVISIQLSADHF